MERTLLKYVMLNVLGALGLSGYLLADTFFVANRLGMDGLAALNLAIPVFGLLNGLGMLLGIGGATRYSICRFQGDGVRAGRTFTRAAVWGGGAGLVLALAGGLGARPLAVLLGAAAETLPLCAVYLRTVFLFSPCFILNHILTAFVRNDGDPRLAMTAMLAGSLSNIALDYLFLYPLDMGIFGAALATGLAPVIGLSLACLHLLTRRNHLRLRRFSPSLRSLADLAGLGSAAFLNELSGGVVLVVYNLLMTALAGTLGVAAYGIVANLALMVLALFTGIAHGAQPLVSQACGRGDGAAVRKLCRESLLLAGLCGLVLTLLAVWTAAPLAALFNQDGGAALQQMAAHGLRLYFPGFLFAGVNLLTAALLGAAAQARSSLLLSLFRGGAGLVPIVILLAVLFGLDGVWLAFPATEAAALLLGIPFRRRLLSGPPVR